MWICKHCEMQNEDWENECYLCGKPQKEPEPVVIQEEKKETAAERIAADPAYRDVQPAVEDFAAAFSFSVDENEEYEPIAQEIEPDDSDFEDFTPDYTDFGTVSPDYTELAGTVADYSDFTEAVFVEQPQEDPVYDAVVPDTADDDMKIFTVDRNMQAFIPDSVVPAQDDVSGSHSQTVREAPVAQSPQENSASAQEPLLWFEDALRAPIQQNAPPASEPPRSSVPAEPKKATDFDLHQFLAQIKQIESDSITEEIRRKQAERKNQDTPAQTADATDPARTKARKRAEKKELNARRHHEAVAMFSKTMRKISLLILTVFMLLTLAFLAVGVWRGNAENIPIIMDEIFYGFELQVRGFLESIQF